MISHRLTGQTQKQLSTRNLSKVSDEYRGKETLRQYLKEYQVKYKEKIKTYKNQYRQKHRDKIREYQREYNKTYQQNNKEKLREYHRIYRTNKPKIFWNELLNKERKEYLKHYHIKNLDKIKARRRTQYGNRFRTPLF
jgi:hypothetical protein